MEKKYRINKKYVMKKNIYNLRKNLKINEKIKIKNNLNKKYIMKKI